MPYLLHYNCYLKEGKGTERIGFFDIESGGSLTADFGICFCWCIKELDGKIHSACIKPDEIRSKRRRDKRVIQEFCKVAELFDKFVVYYGSDKPNRHDVPFLRTRAVKWSIEDFPKWKEKKIVDLYDIIKTKFKFARRRMDTVCKFFGIPSKAHPLNPDMWQDALSGDRKALNFILTHCKEDVISTENLWKKVIEFRGSESTT